MGKVFGSKEHAPINIAGTIIVLGVLGLILGSRDNTVHFAIRMAALKSMRVVGCGVRGRKG